MAGTNASPVAAALHLNNADTAGKLANRFLSIAVQKAGKLQGPKGNKIRVGDDHVAAIILGGFDYLSLKRRDKEVLVEALQNDAKLFDTLADRAADEGIFAWSGRGKNATEDVVITAADYEMAYNELVNSIDNTLNGTNTDPNKDAFDALEVDGHKVTGCKVYKGDGGKDAGEDSRTPEVGAIYIHGLSIVQRVVKAAANPKPKSKSAAKTLAKKHITKWLKLPSRRYVSYRIPANEQWRLKVGGQAALAMTDHGLEITAKDANEVLGLTQTLAA